HMASRGRMVVYYDFVQDDDALLREFDRLSPDKAYYLAKKAALHALVRRGDFKAARQLLEQFNSAGNEMIQSIERGVVEFLAQNPKMALAAYQEAQRVGDKARARVHCQVPLLLLGRKQHAREAYQENMRDEAFHKALA